MTSRACSIRDVAKHVGVAPSTVSRVLNNRMGKLRVARSTRERILAGARALNYAPNIHAKRLFSRRSGVIAFVVPARSKRGASVFQDHHLQEFFDGLENVLSEQELHLLMVFNDRRFADNRDYLSLFREKAIDGMLVWGATAEEYFWPEACRENFPLVFLTNPPFDREGCNFIMHDYPEAARLIMEQLVALGHRRIGWLAGYRENGIVRDLEEGIREVCARHPDVELFSLYGDFTCATAKRQATDLLRGTPDITALVTANTKMANAVQNHLTALGFAVPGDVALAACDCAVDGESASITRVQVDDRLLAHRSVLALLDLVDGGGRLRERLPVMLKLAQST